MAAEPAPAPAPAPEDPEVLIERERRERPRAAIAAAIAAVLLLVSQILSQRFGVDFPDKEPAQLAYLDDNGTEYVASALLTGLGSLALGFVLVFLYGATQARRPRLPPVARACAIAGPILLLVANLVSHVLLVSKAHDFVGGSDRSVAAAKDVFEETALRVPLYAGLAGSIALAFAIVIITLNAMRAGLLTRFMGVLGIIVGGLMIIPIGPLPIVQTFWLAALAVLLSGRWPRGLPPAWERGEAVPWPTQQELRERGSVIATSPRTPTRRPPRPPRPPRLRPARRRVRASESASGAAESGVQAGAGTSGRRSSAASMSGFGELGILELRRPGRRRRRPCRSTRGRRG